jgi:hypothetical protein
MAIRFEHSEAVSAIRKRERKSPMPKLKMYLKPT